MIKYWFVLFSLVAFSAACVSVPQRVDQVKGCEWTCSGTLGRYVLPKPLDVERAVTEGRAVHPVYTHGVRR